MVVSYANTSILQHLDDMSDDGLYYSNVNPQELNRYSYAIDNPLRYVDPEGNQAAADAIKLVMTTGGTLGLSLSWGPAGWIILGATAITVVVLAAANNPNGHTANTTKVQTSKVVISSSNNNNKNKNDKKDPLQKVKDIVDYVKNHDGQAPEGYQGGRTFNNNEGLLPKGVNYNEYDVNPFKDPANRGLERVVIGDDGSVWYTDDHYISFVKVE
jgi:guanyl-specific ribonuclease Sa